MKKNIFVLVIIVIICAACSVSEAPSVSTVVMQTLIPTTPIPRPTKTPTPSTTFTTTSNPTITLTSVLPGTSTETPTPQPDFHPSPPLIIDADNISSLQSLATWEVWGTQDVVWSPDSTRFAVAFSKDQGDFYGLQLIDAYTLHKVWVVELFTVSVAFSPDGNMLAAADPYGGIFLLDVKTGNIIDKLTQGGGEHITFHPNGAIVATGHSYEIIQDDAKYERTYITIIDVETNEKLWGFEADGWMLSLSFSPSGGLLLGWLGGDETDGVVLWEVETGRKICNFSAMPSFFSPDGAYLIVPSKDEWTTEIRDPNTCAVLDMLEGKGYPYDFNLLGQLLLYTSDGYWEIWDLHLGESVGQMNDFPDQDAWHRVSSDWRFVVSVHNRKTAQENGSITLLGVLP